MKNIPWLRLINILVLTSLILGGLYFYMKSGTQELAPVPDRLIPVTENAFAGPYELTNHLGARVDQTTYSAKYKLIYFGFTFCPAICPTELQKITYALNALGDKAQIIQPLFITVDPERDTVETMKGYVSLFHSSLIGLTGTPEDIKAALKTFKIYAAKVQTEEMTEYTMDHSSFIYLIAPDGRLLHIFKIEDTAEDMTAKIGQWLAQEQTQ